MELHKIDNIQELRQERLRLQQEADVALELLHLKVQTTLESGNKGLLGSWKAIIPLVITAGIKKFAGDQPRTATMGGNPFFATFQEGFHAFQRPGNEKWLALFPVILRLWELWQDRPTGASDQASLPVQQEPIRMDEPALRMEKSVLF
jgi:hypothetical protein